MQSRSLEGNIELLLSNRTKKDKSLLVVQQSAKFRQDPIRNRQENLSWDPTKQSRMGPCPHEGHIRKYPCPHENAETFKIRYSMMNFDNR